MDARTIGIVSCLAALALTQCDRTRLASSTARDGAAAVGLSRLADAGAGDAPCTPTISPEDRAVRVRWLREYVAAAVARFEKKYSDGHGGFACPPNDRSTKGAVHDWGDYALAKTLVAGPAGAQERALSEAALRCLTSFQRIDSPDGDERGVFSFHYGDPHNARDNPTEFALAPLAALFPILPPSPALRADLERPLVAALDALERHRTCPKYTNICLTQTAELLALGEVLEHSSDDKIRDFGRARVESAKVHLDEWIAFTRGAGIAEFDSPTYYEVDLNALVLALRAAGDDATRTKIRGALDYFWTDIAANAFPERASLAGPHSRTYSFFAGQGLIALPLYLEGLRAQPPDPGDLSAGLLPPAIDLMNAEQDGYRPAPGILCLTSTPAREVVSTFGSENGAGGRQRYTFVTPDFAMGSTSADYGSLENDQDELVRAELPGGPDTSAIVVLPDYLDSPGAQIKAGAFKKVTHMPMSPAAAQHGGEMLVLLRVPAKDPKYRSPDGKPLPLVSLATNVVVPADAEEILVDGEAADRDREHDVGARPTMLVRMGTGAVAVSVLEAGGLECPGADEGITSQRKATVRFKPLERAGNGHGATARLAIYHDRELPSDPSSLERCFARVALLFDGERCLDHGCAGALLAKVAAANKNVSQSFDPRTGDWDVRVHIAGQPELHVHRIVGHGERLLAREVDGHEMTFAPLRVNDRAVTLGP
jgi:hypothetical protein